MCRCLSGDYQPSARASQHSDCLSRISSSRVIRSATESASREVRDHGPDGNPVSQIVITPVPLDRSPMPFPPGVKPPMLFSIQPGGAVPSQPLPITFPNPTRAAPGTSADLYFFALIAGNWAVWGRGTVSNDGA